MNSSPTFEDEMSTTIISATTQSSGSPPDYSADPQLALAKLELETESENEERIDLDRQAAREDKLLADQQTIQALHEKAGDIRLGGWIGCATSVGGASLEFLHKDTAGRLVSSLGQPLEKVFGEAPATDADARSQAAKLRADAAQSVIEECDAARTRSERIVDEKLDFVAKLLDTRAGTMSHILGRM
jgi:hypothetical protein